MAADAGCGAAGAGGSGWCATSAAADADAGIAMAAAACAGSAGCTHSYRAESTASAAGASGHAVGHGGGGAGGGQVATTASASGGPGFASASASCAGTAGVSCRHSYSAAVSASAPGARASAAGSGGGGVGGGRVAVSAHASSGPGWAAASASCSGAANCRHSYSASASRSASYQGPGPGGSTVRHWARASASGSGGGGQGSGGVAVSAHASAGPTGAAAGASCSGARNCSASFESHSVADAHHDPKHHAHADADCSGSGSGGFCATSAVARADAKSASAGASCSGSGAVCRHSYSAHSDADLKTPTATANGGADCGDSGGFGGGGCDTVAYTEVDADGVSLLHVGCDGPGCRFSGVADAHAGNLIAQGDVHQQCGRGGAGSCTLGVKAELGHDRERENSKIDVLGFCVGSAGANCQGSYSTHIDLGDSTVGDCSGVGSGGCHSETLSGKGHPVVSYGTCIEGLACDWKASTHSDAGLTTADEKLSAEANADCSTTSADGTGGCVTAAGFEVRDHEIVAFASCDGGVGPNCRYHAQTSADDVNGMNTAEDGRQCGQQVAGHCGVSSYAGALTDQNLQGVGMAHHGEAIAGGTCSGSFGTSCTGGFRTHVDSDRDTWSTCTGTGNGGCHGVADPWNANSTGTGTGHIESKSPDEHESGDFRTYGPLHTPVTIGANTHETVGRWFINLGRGAADEIEALPENFVQGLEDTATHFSNWGRLAFAGEEVPRLEGETDEQYDARVWPLKHQWDQSMAMSGKIIAGEGGRDLFWEPVATLGTVVAGPASIIPPARGLTGALSRPHGAPSSGVHRPAPGTAGRTDGATPDASAPGRLPRTWRDFNRPAGHVKEPAIHSGSMPPAIARQLIKREYPWLQGVNAGRFHRDVDGHDENCTECVIATARSAESGSSVPANPTSGPQDFQVVKNRLGQRWNWENMENYNRVIRRMRAAGEGAAGSLYFERRDGSAHVLNVVHDKNGIVFLDGQTGKLGHLPSRPAYVMFLRYK